MEATIDADRPVGDLVREHPKLARVFEAMRIHYCCEGDITLEAACASAGLDVSSVRERIGSVLERRDWPEEDLDPLAGEEWESLSELIDHVEAMHHESLREELTPLQVFISDLAADLGETHPELRDVEAVFSAFATEMREHMRVEESAVFPVVEALDAGESLTQLEAQQFRDSLEGLEDDHTAFVDTFDRIATLTNGFEVPDDAGDRYRTVLYRLKRLERDTCRHVHKENNLLFPQAEATLEPDW